MIDFKYAFIWMCPVTPSEKFSRWHIYTIQRRKKNILICEGSKTVPCNHSGDGRMDII